MRLVHPSDLTDATEGTEGFEEWLRRGWSSGIMKCLWSKMQFLPLETWVLESIFNAEVRAMHNMICWMHNSSPKEEEMSAKCQ